MIFIFLSAFYTFSFKKNAEEEDLLTQTLRKLLPNYINLNVLRIHIPTCWGSEFFAPFCPLEDIMIKRYHFQVVMDRGKIGSTVRSLSWAIIYSTKGYMTWLRP